jgi:hypothetical protein
MPIVLLHSRPSLARALAMRTRIHAKSVWGTMYCCRLMLKTLLVV